MCHCLLSAEARTPRAEHLQCELEDQLDEKLQLQLRPTAAFRLPPLPPRQECTSEQSRLQHSKRRFIRSINGSTCAISSPELAHVNLKAVQSLLSYADAAPAWSTPGRETREWHWRLPSLKPPDWLSASLCTARSLDHCCCCSSSKAGQQQCYPSNSAAFAPRALLPTRRRPPTTSRRYEPLNGSPPHKSAYLLTLLSRSISTDIARKDKHDGPPFCLPPLRPAAAP